MNKTDSITKLTAALIKAQSSIKSAKKDNINPQFKSKYADLSAVIDAIKEALNTNGIFFTQIVGYTKNRVYIETALLHESGEMLSGKTPVFISETKYNESQAFGSAVTYSKRYALQAMLGVATEDDDGEAAMGRGKSAAPPTFIKPTLVAPAAPMGDDLDQLA